MIGAVLFGSVARGEDTDASDIDLLFVARDDVREKTKALIIDEARTLRRLSASCESDVRLRLFVKSGDPFVRAIFMEGRILRDTDACLEGLAALCRDPDSLPTAHEAAEYLHSKALIHHRRVHEHLHQLPGDLQLSLMARAQALAILAKGTSSPATFVELSAWPELAAILRGYGLPDDVIAETGTLIGAHKGNAEPLFAEFQRRFSDAAEALERLFEIHRR